MTFRKMRDKYGYESGFSRYSMEWDWLNLLILALSVLFLALVTVRLFPAAASLINPGIESPDGEVRYTRYEVCKLIFADEAREPDGIWLDRSGGNWVDIAYVPAWQHHPAEITLKRCEFAADGLVRSSLVVEGDGMHINLARYRAVANNDGSVHITEMVD